MTQERITSRKNPLLQQVKKLFASRRERERAGLFAADGIKLLEEAASCCSGLQTAILSDGVPVELPEHVRVIRVPDDVMESISPMASPQGAVFLCRLPENTPFRPQKGMLLLDGIQDPGNLGTILRTADALNVPVALLEGCADPYGPKAVRASMGAVFRTPAITVSWEQARSGCREAGVPIAVTALNEDAVDIRRANPGQLAVVIGSEGQGVRREIMEASQQKLIIPMNPHCESLNAAVASAIVMWQMTL